jgi:cystathionine beta-lyase/cystathionine gamma-synthase
VTAAAREVARWEGAEVALMASSGMAAIAATLVSLVRAGERIVAARELYGDTRDLLVRDLPALGNRVELVDVTDADAWRPGERAVIEGQVIVIRRLVTVIHCGQMVPGAHEGRTVAIRVAEPGPSAV